MRNSHIPTSVKLTTSRVWKQTTHHLLLKWAGMGTVFTVLVCLIACAPLFPRPDPTATATPPSPTPPLPSPTPSPLPTPTPTATPIPSLTIRMLWPEQVSALEPVPLLVELVPPPHFSPNTPITATIRAVVVGPGGDPRRSFDLQPVGEDAHPYLYSAPTPLQLPLVSSTEAGDWLVVVMPHTQWPIIGKRSMRFRPVPVAFHDLTGILPAGVQIHVPVDFIERSAQGDQYAGGRVWQYRHGELSLWWAPGPAEPLQYNTAIVMLETTHNPTSPPQITHSEETMWEEQPAYFFRETWPYNAAAPGDAGGPAEAFVIQGPDDWLYVLRLRQIGRDPVPPILSLVRDTFSFSSGVTSP